jgi:hypothetical protein
LNRTGLLGAECSSPENQRQEHGGDLEYSIQPMIHRSSFDLPWMLRDLINRS